MPGAGRDVLYTTVPLDFCAANRLWLHETCRFASLFPLALDPFLDWFVAYAAKPASLQALIMYFLMIGNASTPWNIKGSNLNIEELFPCSNIEWLRGKGTQLWRINSVTLCWETLSFGLVLMCPLNFTLGIQVLIRSTERLNLSKFDSVDISLET